MVDDDLPGLLRDLTGRIAELTQGYPDRLDPITNEALPPSDTGELGYDKPRRRPADDHRRLRRFAVRRAASACAESGPGTLRKMPSFPGDNLDPDRTHGDLLLLVQGDHMMIAHHALRDIMRRTKGRLEGRWAQPCFQRFDESKAEAGRAGRADARGMLGFPDGSQNTATRRRTRVDLDAGTRRPSGRVAGPTSRCA